MMKMTLNVSPVAAAIIILLVIAPITGDTSLHGQAKTTPALTQKTRQTVTFVELGSVKCIPCRMMQPVMESVGKKYGNQLQIVFHDVWTDSGKILAGPYKIRAIPTQVFLDGKGVEFHRHEGFYPEAEIDKLLQNQGLKVLSSAK